MFFFFQAEDGIRDVAVTGVQTCALPISRLFGIGIGQINLFVDTRFATSIVMPIGSLAALTVADRVMELVLGGYAIAVATAILPMMSHQAAAKDYESLKKTLAFSVRIVAFIDRKSTRLNSSHGYISYAVFCLKKKKKPHCRPS